MTDSTEGCWVVAKTKGRQEAWAAENVERQGLTYYLPRIRPDSEERNERAECLFPGYLFIFISGQWSFLLNTFGISNLIMRGNSPAVLPVEELEKIREREDADGFIRLPKPREVLRRFHRGERVRVENGPLSGFNGIYEGVASHDRVRVLFDLLGRKTQVELKHNQVSRVY